MAPSELLKQLNSLMANMFAAGYVDDLFQQLQMLRDESAPGNMDEIINLFCTGGESILGNLTTLLNKPDVDFENVEVLVHQFKGSSESVGACRVKDACWQLRGFCAQKSRDGCLRALDVVRNEFDDVRSKFQTMLKLEEKIRAFLPKH